MNISHHEPSVWELAFGQAYDGKAFPFDCLVRFKHSAVRRGQDHFVPQSTPGVFAGYRCHPGIKWNREYLVWEFSDFRNADLRVRSTRRAEHARAPHVVRVCTLPVGEVACPLKRDDGRVNLDVADPRLAPVEGGDSRFFLPPDVANDCARGLRVGASHYDRARAPAEFASMFPPAGAGEGASPSTSPVPPKF
jgi:hypothetical protein